MKKVVKKVKIVKTKPIKIKKVKKKAKKVTKSTKKVTKKVVKKKAKKISKKKIVKKVASKKKDRPKKEMFPGIVKCSNCGKRIMYKEDCISYYNSNTKSKKLYHFRCQFK